MLLIYASVINMLFAKSKYEIEWSMCCMSVYCRVGETRTHGASHMGGKIVVMKCPESQVFSPFCFITKQICTNSCLCGPALAHIYPALQGPSFAAFLFPPCFIIFVVVPQMKCLQASGPAFSLLPQFGLTCSLLWNCEVKLECLRGVCSIFPVFVYYGCSVLNSQGCAHSPSFAPFVVLTHREN